MSSFKDLKFKKSYSSLKDDLIKDLINPLLSLGVSYHRAVGFFSSTWLKEVSEGLSIFAYKGKKARIVTSIKFSDEDWQAIQNGELNKDAIEKIIDNSVSKSLEELKKALELETLGTLSWLVSEGILEFRVAVPIGKLQGGIFHTKLSLFYDEEGNGVAVFGSQNDSHQATINEESLNIFTSWDFGREYFIEHKKDFEEKWNGNSKTLLTYSISEASRKNIIESGEQYSLSFKKKILEKKQERTLRDYQKQAIESWIDNDYSGLFEMATGSGKTFTAISASVRIFKEKEKLFLVVLVPYQHLVEQWNDELYKFNFKPICCYDNKATWESKAHIELKKFNAGITKKVCLISTHVTACLEPFQKLIKSLNKPWMLIADEVHGLGSKHQRKGLFSSAKYRIGLSATPARWYDREGTEILNEYFKKIVIKYELEDAINDGALTQYEYIPIEL